MVWVVKIVLFFIGVGKGVLVMVLGGGGLMVSGLLGGLCVF